MALAWRPSIAIVVEDDLPIFTLLSLPFISELHTLAWPKGYLTLIQVNVPVYTAFSSGLLPFGEPC